MSEGAEIPEANPALKRDLSVARTSSGPSPAVAAAGFVVVAVALFLVLNARRADGAAVAPAVSAASGALSQPAPPLALPPEPVLPPAPMPIPAAAPSPAPEPAPVRPVVPADNGERRRAPSVVVDLADPRPQAPVQTLAMAAATPTGAAPPTPVASQGLAGLIASSSGQAGPQTAVATPLANPGAVITQGAMIPAVLETAIDSDLPGYTRAVVSRDVRSFDGKAVLVPRGSRLIGEYRNATALGQSRAFVIWNRLIRPDGVSVELASPGSDDLGRAGLTGEVDRHFFSRFGGSILLSVLNAAVAAVGKTPQTQIAIGSPAAAATAAASAQQGEVIPPTVKIAQGEAIRIFVARDLDFSAVGPVK